VVHGVGSSFGGGGLLKVLQLLHQLLTEASLKHREAINSGSFNRNMGVNGYKGGKHEVQG